MPAPRYPEKNNPQDANPPLPVRLLRLIEAGDIDGAIRAGLMDYRPDSNDDQLTDYEPSVSQRLMAAQQKLAIAWEARERYRQRQARLARRTAEREVRRVGAAGKADPDKAGQKSVLPPAAAAALARAKARAAEGGKS